MTTRQRLPRALQVPAILLALLTLGAGPLAAATISGTVRNEAALGLANVDLDFIDLCSGDNIFLSGDKTAADGTFSVVVPAGTYDVHFTPAAGAVVTAADLQDVVVSVNAGLGVITLHPGRLVAGTVLLPGGAPAAGVDLKFVDVATEHRVYLSKDVTNASGQYAVRVPPGTYDLDYRPPVALSYTDAERFGLVVGASDISGLSNSLGTGFVVTGQVRDKNSNRVKNVDIDAYDECTGRRIATAHDNTDVNGNYSVVVPAGTYSFAYDPPRCKALESTRAGGVAIARAKDLGTEQMQAAVAVSGIVHGPDGLPLADARLKFYDVTTVGNPRQPATNDRTDAAGAFSVLVPTGTYDINIEPPPGVDDVVGHLNSVPAGPTSLGVVTLAAGFPVHGVVVGPGFAPVEHVNINVVDSETRVAQRIANDATDATGAFTVVLPLGTYDFEYAMPACTGLAPAAQTNRAIASAVTLPVVTAVTGVHLTGSIVDGGSLPVPNVDLDIYPAGTGNKIYTPNDKTAADGTYDVLVPPGTWDVRYIPSSLTRLLPAERLNNSAPASLALPLTVLENGWFVSGLVRAQATFLPIEGAAVDFFPPGNTTAPLWTPHHVTGVDGAYAVPVPAGTWDVRFTPPAGAPLGVTWVHGVAALADVALADQLLPTAVTGVNPGALTAALALSTPRPNPTSGACAFSLVVPAGEGELTLWNVAGRRVAQLWRGRAPEGALVRWNGAGDGGVRLSAGIYYARLTMTGGAVRTRPVVVLP